MKTPDENPDPVDINLDVEPIGDASLAAAAAAAAAAAPSLAEEESAGAVQQALVTQLAKLQAEKDDLYQTLVRRQADFENFRKRVERERQDDARRMNAILIENLLPVLDAFERALASHGDAAYEQHRMGFELIYKQLLDVLGRQGLEKIEAAGKPFDPFFHQAIERVPNAELEEGTVVEELQRGYKFKGSVLRPTMVRVSTRLAPQEPAAAESPATS